MTPTYYLLIVKGDSFVVVPVLVEDYLTDARSTAMVKYTGEPAVYKFGPQDQVVYPGRTHYVDRARLFTEMTPAIRLGLWLIGQTVSARITANSAEVNKLHQHNDKLYHLLDEIERLSEEAKNVSTH